MKTRTEQNQLELGFNGSRTLTCRRESRASRARWWFEQMRQVVDRATDWQPNKPGRPEQIWFGQTHHQSRN